jgi:hypothetical protein
VSLLSADGKQRWDGKKWMPRTPVAQAVSTAHSPAAERPSWLAAGVSMPESVFREIPVPLADAPRDLPVSAAPPIAVVPAFVGVPAAPGRSINKLWILGGAALAVLLMALVAYGAVQVLHPYAYIKVTGANSVAEFAAEQNYNTVYARDVAAINTDGAPYTGTSTTPGVCSTGGTKQGCYDTDQKVIRDVRAMLADLGRLAVPPRFKQGDSDLRAGLQLNVDAITLRDQAIASNVAGASLGPANQKGQQALDLLHKASTEFPADNAPQPKF